MEWLFTWQLLIGLFVGFFLGVFVMCLVQINSRKERDIQKEVGL